jgi:formylglycine-generating enzyme required for sulfatase activity
MRGNKLGLLLVTLGIILATTACSRIPMLARATPTSESAQTATTPIPLTATATTPMPPTRTLVPETTTPIHSGPTATLTPPTLTPALPTPTPVIYVVQAGDTLGAIAKEFGVTVEALQEANALSDPNRLQIDQELVIPQSQVETTVTSTPVSPTMAPDVYVVQAGDTLGAIAKQYGVTVEALQEVNAISDPTHLQIGQKLIIPKGGTIAPTSTATEVRATSTSIPRTPRPVVGAAMIAIPAGEFTMGSDVEDERPPHTVFVDGFEMDKLEVTNQEFERFVQETGYVTDAEKAGDTSWRYYAEDKPQHPVVKVSWNDAVAYCGWAGKRLPTEAEWEKAARGTDARTYPWGNRWDATKANAKETGNRGTTAVGSFPAGASPYGVLDMAGNVAEWTTDWFKAYPGGDFYSPYFGEKYRVIRGGGWFSDQNLVRTTERSCSGVELANDDVGFRCAR